MEPLCIAAGGSRIQRRAQLPSQQPRFGTQVLAGRAEDGNERYVACPENHGAAVSMARNRPDIWTASEYLHSRTVDKLESMIGSYGPAAEPITKRFVSEEACVPFALRRLVHALRLGKPLTSTHRRKRVPLHSPTGMLARSGSYAVRSRVIDDDGKVYADFEWTFKLAKEW